MNEYPLYGGDVMLQFRDDKHLYKVNGKRVDSITGILKVINKPALLYWGINMAIGHLQERLKPGVALDELEILELLENAKKAHRSTASRSATIGNLTHAWVSQHLKGEHPPTPTNPQVRAATEAFLRFAAEHDLKVTESERKLYSRELNVAGTADGYGTYNGEPVVFDLKTGGIYDEALLQCGGYDVCLSEELGIEFKHHLVISCQKNGDLRWHLSDQTDRNRKGFVSALDLFRSLDGVSKELKAALAEEDDE